MFCRLSNILLLSILSFFVHATPNLKQALIECPVMKLPSGEWMDYKFIDSYKGTATGAGLKLLRQIEKQLPVKIQRIAEAPFARQLQELKQGNIDAILGLYDIETRRNDFLLSVPYFNEPLYVFALKGRFSDSTDRLTLNDLDGLIAGIRRDASYGDMLDRYFLNKKDVVTVRDAASIGRLLVKKRIDYFISSGTTEYELKQVSTLIERAGIISSQPTSFAISKNSDCRVWMPYINQLIQDNIKPI